MSGGTEQLFSYVLTVNGQFLGNFDKASGEAATVTEVRHRPGGTPLETTYRSLPSFGTTTLSRVLENERDIEIYRTLYSLAGNALAVISAQPLDDQYNAYGSPITYTGRLGSVKGGSYDSTSSNPRMYEVDVFVTNAS